MKTSQFIRTLHALLLSAAATVACNDSATQAQPPLVEVRVTPVLRQNLALSMEMVGVTLGNQDVPIRTRVEGFLESMDFAEGTFVSKGALLYTVDAQPFKARLVEAQSQLAAARTNHAKALADLGRIRPLAEINAVSAQDLDGAVAQEEASRAGVRAAEAGVELAEIELGYTRITAPIAGLIGLTKAKPGEFVGREPNPVVLNTLSDIDPILVRFSISEREYLRLARPYLTSHNETRRTGGPGAGNSPDLNLILADGSEHSEAGKLVGSAQSIDPQTGTYSVEASFPNPDKLLLPGQFARVRAPVETLENVLVVPRQAVVEIQGLFRAFVVDRDDVVQVREIILGPVKGNEVVVESGLAEGDSLVVEGLQKVKAGMKVLPKPFVPLGSTGGPADRA